MTYSTGEHVTLQFTKDTDVIVTHTHPAQSVTTCAAGSRYAATVIIADDGTPTFDFTPAGFEDTATVDFESYPDCFEVV